MLLFKIRKNQDSCVKPLAEIIQRQKKLKHLSLNIGYPIKNNYIIVEKRKKLEISQSKLKLNLIWQKFLKKTRP